MLLLFDIDGTLLLRAHESHRAALLDAVREVHHVADPGAAHVEAAGRTDGEIAREILLIHGFSMEHIDDAAAELRDVTCRLFAERCPRDLSGHVAPGALDLLEAASARPGVELGLLTGNFEPIARLKLARAGLDRFFAPGQGGFGSDSESRAELPAIARRRAALDGRPYPRERTIVIGDTPRDIACARADGLRCLAVATGPYAAEDLRDADGVAENARGLIPLLRELIV